MYDDALQIFTSGATLVTGAASARVALPNNSAGSVARVIRVSGINACYAKLGDSSVVATNADILIQPADAVVLTVPRGATHIAGIQDAAAGRMNVQAVEY